MKRFAILGIAALLLILAQERTAAGTAKAEAVLAKHAKLLSTFVGLRQIGGDEIPYLWLASEAEDCSAVVHFDYDDTPLFYLRNTCLLDYTLQYLTEKRGGEAMKKRHTGYAAALGVDYSILFTPEEDTVRYQTRKDAITALNKDLNEMMNVIVDED